MDWLEQDLKLALERKDPPPGFAARVTAAAERPASRPKRFPGTVPRWLPVAAAILIVAGSTGAAWRQHQGRVAKDRVMLAMRITAGSLNHIQAHVKEARP